MADVYIPSSSAFEKIKDLVYGFWMDIDQNGTPILLIKLEPSLLTSIIGGCPIEIILRNPHIDKRSLALYIYDNLENPFFIIGNNISDEDIIYEGFDAIAIKLFSVSFVRIVLFNELAHLIFTTKLKIESNIQDFRDWFKCLKAEGNRAKPKDGNYFPETPEIGFSVKIINQNNSQKDKLRILAPEYETIAVQNNPGYFQHDFFVADGKHGNYQELGIASYLLRFFQQEIDFIVSPKNSDDTEFTDFLILDEQGVVVIESKYSFSGKLRSERELLKKAIQQLNKASDLILKGEVGLTDVLLTEKLNAMPIVVKVCMVNDNFIVDEETFKGIIEQFHKDRLPFFISVSSFFQLVAGLKIKNPNNLVFNLLFNLARLYDEYLNSDEKVLYIRDFNLQGISIEELNRLELEYQNRLQSNAL